jgi:hypothetical protein
VTHRQLGTASRERPRKLTQANSIAAPGNQRTQVMSPSPPGDRVVLKIATTKTFPGRVRIALTSPRGPATPR